jgi:hypothetical protein
MRQIASGTVARALMGGALISNDGKLGERLASAFEFTSPVERDRATCWMLLATIACVGAVLRFWGLDSIGLHGDEETMAMAVRHILIDGWPTLPSGMFYPRGLAQLYLMAASVSLFGESEWSLRLPSVLCGIALIPLSYFASRRFLRPTWSLAFSATVAFLPTLIIDSQTARMYIFLVAMITASMVFLFAWERTNRTGWLIASVIALVLGLDMHSLAVATVLMFLLPGFVRGDIRRLLFGGGAALAGVIAFLLIDGWVNAQYPTPPPEFGEAFGPAPRQASSVPRDFALRFDLLLLGLGGFAAFLAWRIRSRISDVIPAVGSIALLLMGLSLQLVLFYHLAVIFYLAGVVVAIRYGEVVARPLAIFGAATIVLMIVHCVLLAPVAGTFTRLVGALVGQPSAWPYVRIAQMSPFAGILTGGLIAWGLYQLAHRRAVPDYWFLAIAGVWAPVFALGLFAWNVPPRYTEMALMPMLICAFATAQRGVDWSLARSGPLRSSTWVIAAAGLAVVLAVNPPAVVAAIDSRDIMFSDHKGAADFMRSQDLTDDDIVLAEDVLQQTYYLGHVDYWLIGPQVARRFVRESPTGVVDFYTGTPVIVTPAMLDRLLKENSGKRIFIIGSGEDWRRGRRLVREHLHDLIESDRFESVFTGRDGRTHVMRAVPKSAGSLATTTRAGEASLVPKSDVTSPAIETSSPPLTE